MKAWTFDPLTTGVLAVVVLAVVLGTLRGRRRTLDWSPWRAAIFGLGVVSVVVTIDGWPGVYAGSLMSVLVSQQLVLLLVSPVLIAFGRPANPLRALVPHVSAPVWLRSLGHALTHPLLGPLLVPAILGVAIFSPLLEQQRREPVVEYLMHLGLLTVGIAIAIPLARDVSKVSSLLFGLALAVGLAELLLDAIPGIALRLDGHVLPGVAILATYRAWGPSALSDQRTAGAILWSVAEILDLPFLLLLASQWFRADARETVAVDARLDAATREKEVRRPVTTEEALGAQLEPLREKPWWEIDGQVFGEVRHRQFTAKAPHRPGPSRKPAPPSD